MSNVFFKESLTSGKPGDFRAICRMGAKKVAARLGEATPEEAARRGWVKAQRPVRIGNRWQDVPVWVEAACDGFETTDPKAFEDHMRTVHGKRPVTGANADLVNRAKGKWRTPKAPAEGRPFKLPKATADLVRTCGHCGFTAEVDDTEAANRYWLDHIDLCVAKFYAEEHAS